jgi:hypothetical protein
MAAPEQNVQGLQFRVALPNGKIESLTVDSDRVLLGSGAHCEIRLPAEHAAVEHVLLTFTGGAIHAESRTLDSLPTLNGVEFTTTAIPDGSVIGVGSAQITVSIVSISDNANVIKKKQEQSSPIVYIAAIVALAVCGPILLFDDDPSVGSARPDDVPALFADALKKCPVGDADQAIVYARDKDFTARGKRERRPFSIEDGVAAVPLFEAAAACYAKGGDDEASTAASDAADELRASVNADYRSHQVRLEHALGVKDLVSAQREVRALLSFTKGLKSQYVTWLGITDRQLQLKLGKKAS